MPPKFTLSCLALAQDKFKTRSDELAQIKSLHELYATAHQQQKLRAERC